MRRLLLLAIVLLGSLGHAWAQTTGGSWQPVGADLSYPRTLLKAGALPSVRASLAATDRIAIYRSLWADVQGAPIADNTASGNRRARATWAKNAAFVVLLGQQPAEGTSLVALSETQRSALVNSTRSLLENLNSNVEVFATWTGTTPYTEWQWRSKELIDYLIAYDLLRGAGESEASLRASQLKL